MVPSEMISWYAEGCPIVGSVGSDGEMLTDLIRHTFLVLPFSYIRRGKE